MKACWKLPEEGYRVESQKKNESVLRVIRRRIACWKLQEERKRVKSYMKNDSVLEVT